MPGLTIIRSVKLNNILSHADTRIEFPLGLTALVGPNGAGKSSIIDAIVYALFANPQNIRGFRGSGKRGFLRVGASSGSIEVELVVGGKRYIVFRSVNVDRGDEAAVYEVAEDGRRRTVASGVQATLDHVRKLLSIPSPDSIRYTVISRQNEVAKFLEETPSVRKELILKLLGLEELEKSRELLKEYLDQVSSERTLLERYKVDLAEIRKRIQEVQQAIELGKSELNKLEEEVARLSKAVSQYEKLVELSRRYAALSRAVELVDKLKELEEALPVCREVLGFKLDRYASVISMVNEGRRGLDEALKRLKELEDRIRSYLSDMRKELGLNTEVDDLPKAIELLEEVVRKTDLDKSFRQAELSIATNSISILKGGARCPLCGRELDDSLRERILADAELKAKRLSNEISRLSEFRSKVARYLEELKKFEKARMELQAKVDSHRRYLEDAAKALEEVRKEAERVLRLASGVRAFSKCVTGGRPDVDTLRCLQRLAIEISKAYEERASMLKRLVGEEVRVEDVVEAYNSVRKQIEELGFDAGRLDVERVEREYKELIGRLNSLKEKVGNARGRIEGYSKMLSELLEKEKELEDRIAKLRISAELYPLLDLLVNKVLGKDGLLARALTSEARRLIEKYANIVLKELGMDFRIRVGEDFSIGVFSSYGELDVRSLSGGETISLAIALRIALAYAVFGRLPGFFVLDEPTQFLDAERRRAVFEIIKRLSERIPQIIVVTHDQEVVELADKVFYVSKEGGRSVVREREKAFELVLRG